jgi:hypothetical protein
MKHLQRINLSPREPSVASSWVFSRNPKRLSRRKALAFYDWESSESLYLFTFYLLSRLP